MKYPHTSCVPLKLARLSLAMMAVLSAAAQAGNTTCNSNGANGPSCTAPTTVTSSGKRNSTQAFAGVNWTFGGGPELVAGVRYTLTNGAERVSGARLEAVFPINTAFTQISFDRLRLRYVGGTRSDMWELGGGYSFASHGVLASAAGQFEHVSLGTDLIFAGMKWLPYVGVDTMVKPKRAIPRNDNSMTCPSGYALAGVAALSNSPYNVDVPAQDALNGKTCYKSAPAV